MTLDEVAKALVKHCLEGTEAEGLRTLYADDAVSVEAMPNPETGQQSFEGLEAIRGKHAYWDGVMEQKSIEIDGPYPHGPDKFAIRITGESVVKETGEPFNMDEVAVYTVKDGKIVREEFFYSM